MSTDVGTAVVQHALDVGRLYLQNAVLTRGIPDQPGRLQVHLPEASTEPPATTPPTPGSPAVAPSVPVAVPPAARSASNFAQWAALAIAALSGSGVIGIPWLLSVINPQPPPTPVPIVQPIERADSSLLQYLEDQGYHLPKEKRPK